MSKDSSDVQKIDELLKWFGECQFLPKKIDPQLLKRFYYTMDSDVEETKKLITTHFKMRCKSPDIFIDRDPTDVGAQGTFEYAEMVLLPGLTPENYKVSCLRLRDDDPQKINHDEDTKVFFMFLDCRFITQDCNEDPVRRSLGEIIIFDMAGFTLKHLSRLSLRKIRVSVRFMQDALPVSLKAIHVVHCPSYLNKIMAVIRPFISTEVYQMIHFHRQSLDELFKYVPMGMLPEEYGGKAGSFHFLNEKTVKCLTERRTYLMDKDYWIIEQP